MYPRTKRDVLKLKVPRQPHGYTFIYPQTWDGYRTPRNFLFILHGYTFIYPQTKRAHTRQQNYAHPHGYTFIYPQTLEDNPSRPNTSTPSRVYFYIPTDTRGQHHLAKHSHTFAGILLYTRRHGRVTPPSETLSHLHGYTFMHLQTQRVHIRRHNDTHPHGYTFIHPQTLEDNSSRPNTFTPSRVYFYAPASQ